MTGLIHDHRVRDERLDRAAARRTPTERLDRNRSRRSPAWLKARAAFLHPLLWVLQAWLAMFYLGAGYAKLTQSPDLLAFLLEWPARAGRPLTLSVGVAEVVLSLGVLAPALSWSLGWLPLIVCTGLLATNAAAMFVFYGLELNLFMASVNLGLILICAGILTGRWRAPRPGRWRRV